MDKALSLDVITLGVPEVDAARDFYTAALSPTSTEGGDAAPLDLHGTGRLALRPIEALAAEADTDPGCAGFRGYVLSLIVERPSEVTALLDIAAASGATVIRPARRRLFGEFAAVHEAPDGTVWKLAAASKRDDGPVRSHPKPTETAIYLGVAKPAASKAFYEALGMSADRSYGDKFVDFTVTDGACRLGVLPRKALTKDTGVDGWGDGFSAAVLAHAAASRDEVDALLAAAESAGGRITVAPTRTDDGGYTGRFTDPDGYHWRITAGARP